MPLTKVSFSVIQVANNVTSTTVGNTTSIPSITFDQNGVITSASNTTLSVPANTTITTPTISGNLSLDSTGTSGIRLPAANTLTFHTAGTEDVRITSAGDVGVGTSSPAFASGTGLEIQRAGDATVRVERTGATASAGEFVASSGLVKIGATSGSPFVFITDNTERLRIPSDAAGITFPATQSASSNANTLDDYEEGTFSPLYLGSTTDPTVTYTNQSGFYTKIGNVVYITANIQWSDFSGGSGILFIGNLPFAASSASFQGGGVISYAFGMPTKGMLYMDAGTSRFVTQRIDSATGYINVPDVASSGHIMLGMFYRV